MAVHCAPCSAWTRRKHALSTRGERTIKRRQWDVIVLYKYTYARRFDVYKPGVLAVTSPPEAVAVLDRVLKPYRDFIFYECKYIYVHVRASVHHVYIYMIRVYVREVRSGKIVR